MEVATTSASGNERATADRGIASRAIALLEVASSAYGQRYREALAARGMSAEDYRQLHGVKCDGAAGGTCICWERLSPPLRCLVVPPMDPAKQEEVVRVLREVGMDGSLLLPPGTGWDLEIIGSTGPDPIRFDLSLTALPIRSWRGGKRYGGNARDRRRQRRATVRRNPPKTWPFLRSHELRALGFPVGA